MIRDWARKCTALFLTAALLGLHGPASVLWAAEKALLEGIEVQPDQLTIHLSEQVRYNTFITAEPPRLVIELLNTEYAAAARVQDGQGKYLKRIRSGQYQKEPSLISRIVMDLSKLVAYRAKWDQSRLVVSLVGASGQAGESSETPLAPSPDPEVEAPPAPVLKAEPPAPAPAPAADVEPPPAAEDAPPAAAKLTGIKIGADELRASLSRKVRINSFTTLEPPRLVVELFGAEHAVSGAERAGAGRHLQRVRTSQFRKAPDLVTRIVMDLDKRVAYQAKWEDKELVISLTGGAPAPETAARSMVDAPSPMEAGPALEKIWVGEDWVRVRLSARAQFNAFSVKEPARLVVEFSGSKIGSAGGTQKGVGPHIKSVRASQHGDNANPLSRVVLELARTLAYTAKWEDNTLVVNLVIPPKPEAPAPPPAAVKAPEPPPSKAPAARNATADLDAAESETAELAPAAVKVEDTPSSELGEMAAGGDVSPGEPEPAPDLGSARAKMAAKGSKPRRDILSTLSTEPITLNYEDMDIRQILKLLQPTAKVNLVYGADVSGSLTLHLVDVPFNEAFMTILSMRGLVANQVGENILVVMTPAALDKALTSQVSQTRVFKLRYAEPLKVKSALEGIHKAEKHKGTVLVDEATKTIIVTDSLNGIAAVERMLAVVDVRPQQVLIEAKLVEVNLTNDFAYGIQWDYKMAEYGKIEKQGLNLVGLVTHPRATTVRGPAMDPMDTNTSATVGTGVGGGRGTGVALPAAKAFGALTLGRITNNYFLSATLTAAASQGKVKVLSDPKITTLDGQKAKMDISTQTTYVTNTVTATGIITETVSYATTGITLEVTPTVNADGRITLKLKPEVSKQAAASVTAGASGAIAIDKRAADTTVMVQSGETIVIGGLITDRSDTQIGKIPLLGDIPLIGWFFKKKFTERVRVELLIFVTTKIVPS